MPIVYSIQIAMPPSSSHSANAFYFLQSIILEDITSINLLFCTHVLCSRLSRPNPAQLLAWSLTLKHPAPFDILWVVALRNCLTS